jgi:hypothetical protein
LKNPKDLLTSLSPNSSEFTSLITGSVEGLKRYYVIVTALDTGLFESTIMPKTAKAIAEELGSYHPLMVEMFCDALAEMGLLTKQEDKYVNSNLASTYLCQKSSHYMENTLQNLKKSVDRWATLQAYSKMVPIMQKRDRSFWRKLAQGHR